MVSIVYLGKKTSKKNKIFQLVLIKKLDFYNYYANNYWTLSLQSKSSETVVDLSQLCNLNYTFAGIIVSSILWDFVIREYIMARYGKRTILLAGLLVDSICNVASVFAKSYYLFLLLKFIAGLV